jgi:hypothetical protein
MTVKELIEELKKFPQDAKIKFYDCQWEHAYWNITHIEEEEDLVVMSDQEYI